MSNHPTVMPRTIAAAESRSFGLIFVVVFPVFLAIALCGQLLGWHWRTWLPGAEGVKSVFGGVKAAVYTFMSYLT
jgi:light-harvesting complex 1 beta chain